MRKGTRAPGPGAPKASGFGEELKGGMGGWGKGLELP